MKISLSFVLICTMFSVLGQSYSDNREKFVKDLKGAISSFATEDDNDFLKEDLAPLIENAGSFSDEYFKKMVSMCNQMEGRKFKAYPFIFDYVYSVYGFVSQKQAPQSFTAWHDNLDKLFNGKNPKRFEDFLEFSGGFFSKQIISKGNQYVWRYVGGSYNFEVGETVKITFKGGNLGCYVLNKNKTEKKKKPYVDSSVIYNTAGLYDLPQKKYEGKGGKVTWEKVGLDKSKTFAELGKLAISMKSDTYAADSVTFNTSYFTKKIFGKLTDRAANINREEDKIYPQFISYEKRLSINNVIPEVDYSGGFWLKGNEFVGVGDLKNPAFVKVYCEGKLFSKALSQVFIVSSNRVTSKSCATAIYFNTNDSIYHQGCDFSFSSEKKILEVSRTNAGLGQAPFLNSYHQLEMYVPKIIWEKGSKVLNLTYEYGVSQEQRFARFESKNLFDSRVYQQFQGLEKVHPLAALWGYVYKYDKYTLTEGDAATALNMTIDQAKPSLLNMANSGFISYNTETKMVVINQKLENYVKAASGKKDYDNIRFITDFREKKIQNYTEDEIKANSALQNVQQEYARNNEKRRNLKLFGTIDLSSMDMDLEGVDDVVLSESQGVFVYPDGNKVRVKQNRDFEFKGWLNAGKMEVKILEGNYIYKEHKVNMTRTANTRLRVKPKKITDGETLIAMNSVMHDIVGQIYVDNPTKRAIKDTSTAKFPKMITSKPSKVYYNDKRIYNGAYDSTRFYYTMEPFSIDSLDDFNDVSFRLKGELTSAGIFPKFKPDLKVMPDYSFGFSGEAPVSGFDFYGTKAKFKSKSFTNKEGVSDEKNKILLSNNGLQGAGSIEFLNSNSSSLSLFTFLPDSTVGPAVFVNKGVAAGVQFPSLESKDAFITYIPKSNSLKARSGRDPILCFDKQVKLTGTTILETTGARANGFMDFDKATVGSVNFKMTFMDLKADTSNFSIKNVYQEDDGEDPIAFKTDDVNSHIDFKARKGIFKSNNGESRVYFPTNQYVCKMDFFTWYMDTESVEMYKAKGKEININTDLDLLGANFISTNPKQDSLKFMAPTANFSLKEKTIYCSKVPYVDIADARFYPDSNKLVIRKKAKMDPLKNATMVANFITKYHKFTKVDAKLYARKVYTAEGDYPYYDKDSLVQYFHMDKIYLDTTYQTCAKGKIADDKKFKLSPTFEYYGDVSIKAASPSITFSGATRLIHECTKFPKNWMSFTADINPKNIQIPVGKTMKTLEGKTVSAGILWRDSRVTDSIRLYPAFLSEPENTLDPVAITADGFLQYNYAAKEFQIGSKEKLINRNVPGNFLALHTPSCSMNGEGVINLGMDYGDVAVNTVGIVNYDQASGKTTMNLTMNFVADIDKGAFEKSANRMLAIEGLKPMDFNGNTLEKAIGIWTNTKTADKIKAEYVLKQELKGLPNELEKGITITGIKLISFNNSAFQNKGIISESQEAILVNVFGKAVGKQINFRMFAQQTYSGAGSDALGFLIQVPGGADLFFDYTMIKADGELKIITNDEELTANLTSIKEDKRKSKNFRYEASTQRVFLTKFMRYFGVTE